MDNAGTSRKQLERKSKNEPQKIYRTRSVSSRKTVFTNTPKQSKNKTAGPSRRYNTRSKSFGTRAIKSTDPDTGTLICQQTVISMNEPQNANQLHVGNKQSKLTMSSLHLKKAEKPIRNCRMKMTAVCQTRTDNLHATLDGVAYETEIRPNLLNTKGEELNETEKSEHNSSGSSAESIQWQGFDLEVERTANKKNKASKSPIPSDIPEATKTIIKSLLQSGSSIKVLEGCILTLTKNFELKCKSILEARMSESENQEDGLNCPQTKNVEVQKTTKGADEIPVYKLKEPNSHKSSENALKAKVTEINSSKAVGVKNKKPVLGKKYSKTRKGRKVIETCKDPVASTPERKLKTRNTKQKVPSSSKSEDNEEISQHQEFELGHDTNDENSEGVCNSCKDRLLEQMSETCEKAENAADGVRFSRSGVKGLVHPINIHEARITGKRSRVKAHSVDLNKYVRSHYSKFGRCAKSLKSTLLSQYRLQKIADKLSLMVIEMIKLLKDMVQTYLKLLCYVRDILVTFANLKLKKSFRRVGEDLNVIRKSMNFFRDKLWELHEKVWEFSARDLIIEPELLVPLSNNMKILYRIKPRLYLCYETLKMLRRYKNKIGGRNGKKGVTNILNTIATEVLHQMEILKDSMVIVQSAIRYIKRILW